LQDREQKDLPAWKSLFLTIVDASLPDSSGRYSLTEVGYIYLMTSLRSEQLLV